MDIRIVLFIIYCVGILALGYYGYLKTKTLADFYVSGRRMPTWVAAGTFAGTFVSAITFVAWIGFGWKFGVALLPVYIFGCLVGFCLFAIVSPRMNRLAHRNNTYTPSDYYEGRFQSSFLRLWTTLFIIVGFFVYLVIQLIGTGLVFEVIVGIPFFWAVILLTAVYTIYTLLGGMRSVAITDTVQFAVFVAAALVAFFYVLPMVGGLSKMNATIYSISPKLLSLTSGGIFKPLWIMGIAFAVIVVIPLHPGYITRMMSCKDEKAARGMVGIGSAILVVFYLAILVLALACRVLIPEVESLPKVDKAFPTMVLNFFPKLLAGFILAALGAAVMSTTDSILLQVGTNAAHDIYNRYINREASEQTMIVVARIMVICFAIAVAILSLSQPAVLWQLYNFFIVFLVAPFFSIFFLGLYWKRATKMGAIVGSVSGGVIGIICQAIKTPYHPTLYAVPISLVLMIVVSYLTEPLPEKVVNDWFEGS